jgi:hypothetical protein
MLGWLQMFKFILLRAVQITAQVFSDADVLDAKRCQKILKEYNVRAKRVWGREGVSFFIRRRECKAINMELLGELDKFPKASEFKQVPADAAEVLDSIFKKHYSSGNLCLLFGSTDDRALDLQDAYGLSIAKALKKLDERYEARAHLHLRKRYGRGAPLPLLSKASVEAMWDVCSSYFYYIQIKTVSPAATRIQINANVGMRQLHVWFEPLPEVLERLDLGFAYCLHWFLRPKEGRDKVIFGSVSSNHRLGLTWITDLDLVLSVDNGVVYGPLRRIAVATIRYARSIGARLCPRSALHRRSKG